jgi:hypothetical protein
MFFAFFKLCVMAGILLLVAERCRPKYLNVQSLEFKWVLGAVCGLRFAVINDIAFVQVLYRFSDNCRNSN